MVIYVLRDDNKISVCECEGDRDSNQTLVDINEFLHTRFLAQVLGRVH